MRALDITKHKTHLTNILMDFYKDSLLSSALGFKGGTAAMLFYDLPRFSVDLDFDLIGEPEAVVKRISELLSTKYEVVDSSTKFNTLFWLVSYEKYLAKIKVEVSTRDNPYNEYSQLPFYGVMIRTMNLPEMIAHKLVAVMERTSIANRDLFDVHYFLSSPYGVEINYEVIKHRTGKDPEAFYDELLTFLQKVDNNHILNGLGEVLTESQKDWAKAKLIEELVQLVKRVRDSVGQERVTSI